MSRQGEPGACRRPGGSGGGAHEQAGRARCVQAPRWLHEQAGRARCVQAPRWQRREGAAAPPAWARWLHSHHHTHAHTCPHQHPQRTMAAQTVRTAVPAAPAPTPAAHQPHTRTRCRPRCLAAFGGGPPTQSAPGTVSAGGTMQKLGRRMPDAQSRLCTDTHSVPACMWESIQGGAPSAPSGSRWWTEPDKRRLNCTLVSSSTAG